MNEAKLEDESKFLVQIDELLISTRIEIRFFEELGKIFKEEQ